MQKHEESTAPQVNPPAMTDLPKQWHAPVLTIIPAHTAKTGILINVDATFSS
ncbi:hypothetical protein [Bradyrhizobium sp. HKCCYLS20291]|uniref:hypothetical protein n=1 Tax=Bradyrhizobium sp. HKCCYLS20291 TaxID=3420766 RepID=UPI003EB9106F